MSSSLMKQKYNCLAIMTIVMFGGKRGRLASQRTPCCHHVSGSIMLWGCFAAGGTGALHKIDGSMRKEHYVDILKQDISQEVKSWLQMGLPNGH